MRMTFENYSAFLLKFFLRSNSKCPEDGSRLTRDKVNLKFPIIFASMNDSNNSFEFQFNIFTNCVILGMIPNFKIIFPGVSR